MVLVLDELANGRTLEAADILSSRLASYTLGLEADSWELADEFLSFRPRQYSLMSNEAVDVALGLAKKRLQREDDLKKLANSSRARPSRSAGR